MVVVRLQRRGTKKAPHHRIIASDRTRSQRGRVLEALGFYDPSYNPPRFSIDVSRLAFWISAGAQVSEAVSHLIKRHKKVAAAVTTT